MKIALAAEGTRGDVFPILDLARRFADAGHEVVVSAPPDFASDAAQRGLGFEPVGRSVRAVLDEIAAAVTGSNLAVLREAERYLQDAIALQFEALSDTTRGADRIFGAGVQLAAASAAQLHGVPYRYVVYCAGLIPSREYPPVVIPVESLPPWLTRVSWGVSRWMLNRALRRRINRHREKWGLGPVADLFPYILSDRPILAVDADLAPAPADAGLSLTQIPCLHSLAPEPLPAKLEGFLEAGPPPVYIGFGSMTDPSPERTTATLLEAIAAAGCRALVSHGWAGLAQGSLPEGVMPVGSVSHAALFPRCAAVVHHGGAGTTHSATRAGVPQLVIPHLLDQFYWAGRVRQLGLGPPAIRRTRLTAGRLAMALREIVDNEILAERANEVGERSRHRASLPLDLDALLAAPQQRGPSCWPTEPSATAQRRR